MKKKVDQGDFSIEQVEQAIEKKAETTKDYIFKRTYIGMLGAFYKNQSYELTEEQYEKLKRDIE
jgi:hypothetical protein